ncbi:MAG: hypothetical protein IMZ75_09030 [Actinobacteria bacterium]|nr:hypothetical protein [Actinomycetota bacterium]
MPVRGADAHAAVRPGDRRSLDSRTVHTDLHYENVLAADRQPWLAIGLANRCSAVRPHQALVCSFRRPPTVPWR